MKTIIELDKSDVCKIIAEKYSVPVDAVSISFGTEYVGYGPMEEKVTVMTCKVLKKERDNAER